MRPQNRQNMLISLPEWTLHASARQNAAARPLIDWSPAANDHGDVSERAEGTRLDPIEKAIRNAFEKGNAEDRVFRERVYRSAFAALDQVFQCLTAQGTAVPVKQAQGLVVGQAQILFMQLK